MQPHNGLTSSPETPAVPYPPPEVPAPRVSTEGGPAAVTVWRTSAGWRVTTGTGDEHFDNLGDAMVLADLLSPDLGDERAPRRAGTAGNQLEQLRMTVAQLEYALRNRVVVERAIGVLAERFQLSPNDAFARLRRVARSQRLRVRELADDVLASALDDEKLINNKE